MSDRPARVRSLLASAATVAILLFSGCAAYQLGAPSQPGFQSVFIPLVTSDAFLPQSRAIITTHLREAFARDGRVTLAANAAEADRVLEVHLADFTREMAAARRDDTALARSLALSLEAQVTLVDRSSGRKFLDHAPVKITMEAYVDNGQQQSEYQTVPLLAGKLSAEIVHLVLDTW